MNEIPLFFQMYYRKENQAKQARKEAEAKEKAVRRVYVFLLRPIMVFAE